jgi:hypothetical protein
VGNSGQVHARGLSGWVGMGTREFWGGVGRGMRVEAV